MTETCKFNVGGRKYEVSRSLLEQHPNTMLARISSAQWQSNPTDEIFIDRDGDRFRYILDYLRDAAVSLPANVPKKALLKDLAYYGIENIDEECIDDGPSQGLLIAKSVEESEKIMEKMEKEMKDLENMKEVIKREMERKLKETEDKKICVSCAMMLFRRFKERGELELKVRPNTKEYQLALHVFNGHLDKAFLDKCLERLGLELVDIQYLGLSEGSSSPSSGDFGYGYGSNASYRIGSNPSFGSYGGQVINGSFHASPTDGTFGSFTKRSLVVNLKIANT
mmetsp:Transcript_22506/g.33751  ORF Transcript_22506/g.33751 Transcript_22506/m.33751 type:complete len:281 (-) Transcript_22506:537-1379(-)